MGESPLVDSVSSGRTIATISPIRNAVELAGPGSYLKTKVQASWTAGMRAGEPSKTAVPSPVLRRCQLSLSIGLMAISNKPGVRRTTYPRSAVLLDRRPMIHNNLSGCLPLFTVLRCCRTIIVAFRLHPALASTPRITTDRTQPRTIQVIRTFHQSRHCPSMGH